MEKRRGEAVLSWRGCRERGATNFLDGEKESEGDEKMEREDKRGGGTKRTRGEGGREHTSMAVSFW